MPEQDSNAIRALRDLASQLGYAVAEADLPALSEEFVDLLFRENPHLLCSRALAERSRMVAKRVLRRYRDRDRKRRSSVFG